MLQSACTGAYRSTYSLKYVNDSSSVAFTIQLHGTVNSSAERLPFQIQLLQRSDLDLDVAG